MADSMQMADHEAMRMGLISGLITGLGCELDQDGAAWLVTATRDAGASRWVLCDEVREGEDIVLRRARYGEAAQALDAAARLVPPGI